MQQYTTFRNDAAARARDCSIGYCQWQRFCRQRHRRCRRRGTGSLVYDDAAADVTEPRRRTRAHTHAQTHVARTRARAHAHTHTRILTARARATESERERERALAGACAHSHHARGATAHGACACVRRVAQASPPRGHSVQPLGYGLGPTGVYSRRRGSAAGFRREGWAHGERCAAMRRELSPRRGRGGAFAGAPHDVAADVAQPRRHRPRARGSARTVA